MIREFFTSLTTTCAPGARAHGLADEAASIIARHGRNKTAWAPHIENTKATIKDAIKSADPREPILVLGAGPCIDIPLEELNSHPAGALLIDAVFPLSARKQIKNYSNLAIEHADITGLMAQSIDPILPETAPIPLAGFSLIISCNILSQLHLPYAPSPPASAREAEIMHLIQQAHVNALKSAPCPVLLISDYERHENDTRIETISEGLLEEPAQTWDWHIAPKGEVHKDLDIRLTVGAWQFTA